MSPHIKIQWVGIRKDSGRGSICGWFTEAGKREHPKATFWDNTPIPVSHYFQGKIGGKLNIVQQDLTDEFLGMIGTKQKNYKTVLSVEKLESRWGKSVDEELSMYIMFLKIKNG